ncbi:DUF72 domain-containing protein [Massilia yuzhufengensis]|uniref:Uncharacterized conserved protein YecE, DUF72 family n=1 Tax=Massilia yuzhufengensis TaxID=1164594 RepID=A0A1I1WTV8_9BURK|nr:DUF72 domain-containing protein [Massilia yuzhufengensis]SFD98556.1 Uncharacterized conserved protein YecE, DUF72 family [Massilia yuzhufengensis]
MTKKATPTGRLLVGCAGSSLPKASADAFPAEGSHLERYAAVFPALEINSSFYRPHRPATYVRWADSVPEDFRFAVKVPRAITHDARLVDVEQLLVQFAHEAGELGDKLGCLLVQLPPKFGFIDQAARDFFGQLHRIFGCSVAFEARHPSWFSEAATELLAEHRVTRVIADPAAGQPGPHVPTSAETVYVRLHGTPRIYYSRYTPEYVESVRRDLARHVAAGRTCWCIFDNTASGEAVANALELLHGTDGQALDDKAILSPPW